MIGFVAGLGLGLAVAMLVRVRWLDERRWHRQVIDAHARHLRVQRVAHAEQTARTQRYLAALGVDDLPEVQR